MIDPQRLLNRFLQYVRIDTTADDSTDDYPSSPGQWTLGKLLVEQLRELGAEEVEHDRHGLIYATIPSTLAGTLPTIAFNAHLDTSPETSGANVQPQLVRDYAGGDLILPGPGQQVIRVKDNPELEQLHGCTLITTDGTTLLGADDKAGLAVIMEAAACWLQNPQLRHGRIRLLFTCDEEIGRGTEHVDLERLGATVCYTLDGPGADAIDVETFSADLATVRVHGVNIHPSIAQDRMVNAVRAVAELVARLPRTTLSPEATADRAGFLHPYHVSGGVAEVSLKVLLRDFETSQLAHQAELLRRAAAEVERGFPGAAIDVSIRPQYRNLREGLEQEPRAVAWAERALQRLGTTARRTIIRGGTDGSLLTQLGLPTPNLSTGEHNPHSPLEWTCLEEMCRAARWIVELAQVWGEEAK